jgi:hypothetical protein
VTRDDDVFLGDPEKIKAKEQVRTQAHPPRDTAGLLSIRPGGGFSAAGRSRHGCLTHALARWQEMLKAQERGERRKRMNSKKRSASWPLCQMPQAGHLIDQFSESHQKCALMTDCVCVWSSCLQSTGRGPADVGG